MDRSVKLTLAASVVLGGAMVSLLFRREPPRAVVHPSEGGGLVLRERIAPQSSIVAPLIQPNRPLQGQIAPPHGNDPTKRVGAGPLSSIHHPVQADRPATVLTPAEPLEVPRLPKSFPTSSPRLATRWGTSLLLGVPDDSPKTIRHRITDGDTLPSLAERYLGSADRHREIYEANRDLLKSPDLLPIGIEVKIPIQPPPPTSPASGVAPLVAQPIAVPTEAAGHVPTAASNVSER